MMPHPPGFMSPAMAEPTPAQQSAALIRECTNIRPAWAVICGSGLSGVADALEERVIFPYESLFGFEPAAIEGHPGSLVMGRLGRVWVAVFQGRTHLYEGKGLEPTLAAVRLAHALHTRRICITNAAGALRPPLRAGWLMPFTGHLNLAFLASCQYAPRPAPRSGVYDPDLLQAFLDTARDLRLCASPGVYALLTGPTYETPAEARAYRILGADAAGMSTVHEAIEARRLGLRVLAVSAVTNDAVPATDQDAGPTHEAVLACARRAADNLTAILTAMFNRGDGAAF